MSNVKKTPKRGSYLILAILLTITIIIPSYYFYNKYQTINEEAQNPALKSEKELQKLIDEVGRKIRLPTGEKPTIATISDKEKLADQPFFNKAKKGDKILIYDQAGMTLIYDPVAKKIIDVAEIDNSPTAIPTDTLPEEVVIAIYNGTDIRGLAKIAADQIKMQIPTVEVADTDNSLEQYQETLLIDLSNAKSSASQPLLEAFRAKPSQLPSVETAPVSTISGQIIDFLLILGTNYTQSQ